MSAPASTPKPLGPFPLDAGEPFAEQCQTDAQFDLRVSGTGRAGSVFYGFLSFCWNQQMQEYRAYIMGLDGHVQKRVDLQCNNDDEAIRLTRQLVNDYDVELWATGSTHPDVQGPRRVLSEINSFTLAVRAP